LETSGMPLLFNRQFYQSCSALCCTRLASAYTNKVTISTNLTRDSPSESKHRLLQFELFQRWAYAPLLIGIAYLSKVHLRSH